MEIIIEYLPFLIPLIIVELILIIIALRHLYYHRHPRLGNCVIWIPIIILVQIIGPVLYFVIGREHE